MAKLKRNGIHNARLSGQKSILNMDKVMESLSQVFYPEELPAVEKFLESMQKYLKNAPLHISEAEIRIVEDKELNRKFAILYLIADGSQNSTLAENLNQFIIEFNQQIPADIYEKLYIWPIIKQHA